MSHDDTKIAILLLGHGSRVPDAAKDMERVAARLREQLGPEIVEVGHMSLASPTLGEAVDACLRQGATAVMILPYFLHLGVHLREDIPRLLGELQTRTPGVRFVLGHPLGYDDCLVDLVRRRIDITLSEQGWSSRHPERRS